MMLTPAIDLAHIAKTSYGIATSPTNGGAGILATSPTQAKNLVSVSPTRLSWSNGPDLQMRQ
jgi:hypothetical protein